MNDDPQSPQTLEEAIKACHEAIEKVRRGEYRTKEDVLVDMGYGLKTIVSSEKEENKLALSDETGARAMSVLQFLKSLMASKAIEDLQSKSNRRRAIEHTKAKMGK